MKTEICCVRDSSACGDTEAECNGTNESANTEFAGTSGGPVEVGGAGGGEPVIISGTRDVGASTGAPYSVLETLAAETGGVGETVAEGKMGGQDAAGRRRYGVSEKQQSCCGETDQQDNPSSFMTL